MECCYCPLPDVLLTEILLRLPVQSLLRFKCVCKNWYSLITSSSFIREHLRHENTHALFLIHFCGPSPSKLSTSIILPEKILTGVTPVHEKPNYLQIPAQLNGIIGPVDGIFFLYKNLPSNHNRLALWNPAIREFRPIPVFHFEIDPGPAVVEHFYGFGLDSLSLDYKVVHLWYFIDSDIIDTRVYASVYSLGTGSWRNLTCNFEYNRDGEMRNCSYSTCVNGVYYWITYNYEVVGPRTFYPTIKKIHLLRTFDMHAEVFGEISGPDDISGEYYSSLILYKESIGLLVHRFDSNDLDIWLMNGQSSWIKVLNVVPRIQDGLPIGLWEPDMVILIYNGNVVLYGYYSHEVTHLVDTESLSRYVGAFSYKETLVSIKRSNVRCTQGDIFNVIQDYFRFR